MKRKYIAPDSFVVIVHLNNSVLESVGVNNGSPYGKWEDAAGKRNASVTESDEEEETPVGTVGGDKSVWDD